MIRSGPLRLRAPAKINLYLHVTGRRPDGYHLLDSLVAFTTLADELTIEPADRLTLSVTGPFAENAGEIDDNLVLRAARALASAAGVSGGVSVHLTKNIPAAAGLGGGSADAAATLTGLCRLWGVDPASLDLQALAAGLGADVPVCLFGQPAFIGGIGERIDAAPRLPPVGVLLVNPSVSLPTGDVFRHWDGPQSGDGRFNEPPADAAALAASLVTSRNDLTKAAISLAPVVTDVLEAIRGLPGCRLARMTGSGATCFGLFDDARAAAEAAGSLTHADWWHAATVLA